MSKPASLPREGKKREEGSTYQLPACLAHRLHREGGGARREDAGGGAAATGPAAAAATTATVVTAAGTATRAAAEVTAAATNKWIDDHAGKFLHTSK